MEDKFFIRNIEEPSNVKDEGKHKKAMIAGMCILGAVSTCMLTGCGVNEAVSNDLNSLVSNVGNFFENIDIGSVVAVAAAGFIGGYLNNKDKNKNKDGGNDNAKTR